jgi:hypothetical protein
MRTYGFGQKYVIESKYPFLNSIFNIVKIIIRFFFSKFETSYVKSFSNISKETLIIDSFLDEIVDSNKENISDIIKFFNFNYLSVFFSYLNINKKTGFFSIIDFPSYINIYFNNDVNYYMNLNDQLIKLNLLEKTKFCNKELDKNLYFLEKSQKICFQPYFFNGFFDAYVASKQIYSLKQNSFVFYKPQKIKFFFSTDFIIKSFFSNEDYIVKKFFSAPKKKLICSSALKYKSRFLLPTVFNTDLSLSFCRLLSKINYWSYFSKNFVLITENPYLLKDIDNVIVTDLIFCNLIEKKKIICPYQFYTKTFSKEVTDFIMEQIKLPSIFLGFDFSLIKFPYNSLFMIESPKKNVIGRSFIYLKIEDYYYRSSSYKLFNKFFLEYYYYYPRDDSYKFYMYLNEKVRPIIKYLLKKCGLELYELHKFDLFEIQGSALRHSNFFYTTKINYLLYRSIYGYNYYYNYDWKILPADNKNMQTLKVLFNKEIKLDEFDLGCAMDYNYVKIKKKRMLKTRAVQMYWDQEFLIDSWPEIKGDILEKYELDRKKENKKLKAKGEKEKKELKLIIADWSKPVLPEKEKGFFTPLEIEKKFFHDLPLIFTGDRNHYNFYKIMLYNHNFGFDFYNGLFVKKFFNYRYEDFFIKFNKLLFESLTSNYSLELEKKNKDYIYDKFYINLYKTLVNIKELSNYTNIKFFSKSFSYKDFEKVNNWCLNDLLKQIKKQKLNESNYELMLLINDEKYLFNFYESQTYEKRLLLNKFLKENIMKKQKFSILNKYNIQYHQSIYEEALYTFLNKKKM